MEILIIGGLVVALMVFVSTKIKRSAARAYEAETIETEEFTVSKPEGFLHPLREPADFPFEAYSRQYGERSTRNIWRARARLRVHDGSVLDGLLSEAAKNETITSREIRKDNEGRRECLARSRRIEDEVEYSVYRRLIECPESDRTYDLRVTMLAPYEEEFSARANDLLGSFTLKLRP